MNRDITPAVAAALAAPHVQYMMFVELEFDGGTLRFCNANRNFDWNGFTWLGFGQVANFAPIDEVGDMSSTSMQFQLSGIDPDNVSLALGENCQGRPCRLWIAFCNVDTQAIVADPIGPYRYRMDTMPVELGATATVGVTARSRLADLNRARVRRYNDADQQARYPGDNGLKYAALMVERSLLWGVDG